MRILPILSPFFSYDFISLPPEENKLCVALRWRHILPRCPFLSFGHFVLCRGFFSVSVILLFLRQQLLRRPLCPRPFLPSTVFLWWEGGGGGAEGGELLGCFKCSLAGGSFGSEGKGEEQGLQRNKFLEAPPGLPIIEGGKIKEVLRRGAEF